MYFEWDEIKNRTNIKKHGIDFVDVVAIFDNTMLISPDSSAEYGEDRWVGIGWIAPLICIVIYTERENGITRIISARKATKFEVARYEKIVKN